jgi:hypothetical protein
MEATIILNDGEILVKQKAYKSKTPNYFRIGNGTMNKQGTFAIDLITEVAMASKAGQFLLLAIKNNIIYDNNYSPVVKVIAETKHQKNMLSAGYKEMHEKGLVRRVKRGHYMINPNALIPLDYEEAKEIWDSIEGPDYVKPTDRL